MISVCIPVYNYNVVRLINDLTADAQLGSIPIEIVVIDDASDPGYKKTNAGIRDIEVVKYIELEHNIGRSKIRNLFLKYVRFENLLFIDCDAELIGNGFIKKYSEAFDGQSVIAGGVAYSEKCPGNEYSLRWNYGHKRESTNAIDRSKDPYKSFKTFNFAVPHQVMDKIRFDENVIGYGHEDTLFGLELKKAGIRLVHIENPLIHTGLEPNDVFLKKTRQGIDNLLKLYFANRNNDQIARNIKLMYIFSKLNPVLKVILYLLFIILRPLLEFYLRQQNPNVRIFDFYKLGYMCSLKRKA